MTAKEEKLIGYLKAESSAEQLLREAGLYFDRPTIWEVLVEYFEKYDTPTDVLYEELSGEQIFSIISEYYDRNGRPVVTANVDAEEYLDEITDGKIDKAQIKIDGTVWTVHRSDRDSFPSNPHAHDYDNHVKLDLGTGLIYRGKEPYKIMSKKELKALRYEISSRLPDLQLPSYTR